jgi:L-ascorbate metabolism protein UlaG (beta-lactamase superfamily)
MVEIEELPLGSPLATELARPLRSPQSAHINWLGQAGFALRGSGRLLLIDPYLSDSLAEKYRGKEFPHIRMMPSPLDPKAAPGVYIVLCTHRHSDHMDPGTLPAIADSNPECMFVVPKAETAHALILGLLEARLWAIDAGDTLRPIDGIQVEAIASAHEHLARNEQGEFLHLGYIVTIGGLRIYHSGDCVPYEGLEETLRASAIDVALLPINGRNDYLASRGIAGNFHLEEAVELCKTVGIRLLFCHHWGLFDFNTVDPSAVAEKIGMLDSGVRCIMPRIGVSYRVKKA